MAQYYRIEDNQDLTKEIKHGTGTKDAKNITSTDELKILSYNIGFGAYDQEYDFFMDEGYMKDGSYIRGTHSRALSYEAADRNTNGSVDIVKEKDIDFAIIQEVDTDSDRCYRINQY